MPAIEQVDYPAILTEAFELASGVFAWSEFCGSAGIEDLRLAHGTIRLKVQAISGRLRLAQQPQP